MFFQLPNKLEMINDAIDILSANGCLSLQKNENSYIVITYLSCIKIMVTQNLKLKKSCLKHCFIQNAKNFSCF